MDKLIALNTEVIKAKCPKSGIWENKLKRKKYKIKKNKNSFFYIKFLYHINLLTILLTIYFTLNL